jgi:DNA repair exonuclease SbcCD ATPase subunit
VRLTKGTLIATNKWLRTHDYTVKNSGHNEKKVLIEYPLESDWKLVAPEKPEEKTRDRYRFAVQAKPGQPAKLHVAEERTDSQQIALSNLDESAIGIYLRAKVISDKVKAALAEIVKRKTELSQASQKRTQLQPRIQEISEEQGRIRQNMERLDQASDIYKRYVKKFSDQENEVERLRAEIQQTQSQENALHKALDDYLMGLDLS